jgi:hypothetical protein
VLRHEFHFLGWQRWDPDDLSSPIVSSVLMASLVTGLPEAAGSSADQASTAKRNRTPSRQTAPKPFGNPRSIYPVLRYGGSGYISGAPIRTTVTCAAGPAWCAQAMAIFNSPSLLSQRTAQLGMAELLGKGSLRSCTGVPHGLSVPVWAPAAASAVTAGNVCLVG